MPWQCPGCKIQREPAGTHLATEHEYCTQGIPFTPFNKKECCKCQGKTKSDFCSSCKKRSAGKSGSSDKHHKKTEHLERGLCGCGRPRGHAFDPRCSVAGTVAYVSKCGEGKIPPKEWGKRAFNITKGAIQVYSGDVLEGMVTLALEERKAAGDPNVAGMEHAWGLCTADPTTGGPAQDFDAVMEYVVDAAEEEGWDQAEEKLEEFWKRKKSERRRRGRR